MKLLCCLNFLYRSASQLTFYNNFYARKLLDNSKNVHNSVNLVKTKLLNVANSYVS